MPKQPIIRAFFDQPTNTVSYLVADPVTRQARAVIDPVLDYDHKSGEVDTRSVETILKGGAKGPRLDGRLGLGNPRACRTICRARPTSRRSPGPRSALASTSRMCSASSSASIRRNASSTPQWTTCTFGQKARAVQR